MNVHFLLKCKLKNLDFQQFHLSLPTENTPLLFSLYRGTVSVTPTSLCILQHWGQLKQHMKEIMDHPMSKGHPKFFGCKATRTGDKTLGGHSTTALGFLYLDADKSPANLVVTVGICYCKQEAAIGVIRQRWLSYSHADDSSIRTAWSQTQASEPPVEHTSFPNFSHSWCICSHEIHRILPKHTVM